MGKNLKYLPLLFLAIVISSLIQSCDEGCTQPYVGYNRGKAKKLKNSNYSPDKIRILAPDAPDDTTAFASITDSSVFKLAMNPDTTATQFNLEFIFSRQDTLQDTTTATGGLVIRTLYDTIADNLVFYYENKEFFLDIECGCSVFHFLDSVRHTSNIIQQVEIVNPEITNESSTNFKIYY